MDVCHVLRRQWDPQSFNKQTLLGSSMSATLSSYYIAFIHGDSFLPRTGPLSKFFSAVRGTDRISS